MHELWVQRGGTAEPPSLHDPAEDSFLSTGFSSDSWLAGLGGLMATSSGRAGDTELVVMLSLPLCDLGKSTPYPRSSFPSLKNRASTSSLPHRESTSQSLAKETTEKGGSGRCVAQRQGHAALSEPRIESPASPPHAVVARQGGYRCLQNCPAHNVARTPYGTQTLPVRQEQKAVMGRDTTPCLLSIAD